MITQNMLADAASTLAHLWARGEPMDHIGFERLILVYPAATQLALCVQIGRYLEERSPGHVIAYMAWLHEMATEGPRQ